MRSVTAKHKGYEEFDSSFVCYLVLTFQIKIFINLKDAFGDSVTNSTHSSYDEYEGMAAQEEFKNYPTIKTEKSHIKSQKTLSVLNPKNVITSITSTLKRK